ncbi:MAG: hypothetical protein FRX49_09600 [Trebouxia sp. A1-2]|nr:MAG: hypothetical protein FRX49_09600 [Trebouxia sp. A1-2]
MDPPAPSGDAKLDDIVDPDHLQDNLQDEEDDETPSNRGGGRSSKQQPETSSFRKPAMDLDALTSASEFHMAVNAWMADIDAEQRQAATIPAYQNTEAATKDTLSNIFAPALLPLLDDDSILHSNIPEDVLWDAHEAYQTARMRTDFTENRMLITEARAFNVIFQFWTRCCC